MERKKILWLCSWYPNRAEPFNGDFIQRHARATALYDDVHVIHVAGVAGLYAEEPEEVILKSGNLVEHTILFRKGAGVLSRLADHFRWVNFYKKAIKKYIAENGLPGYVHVHIPLKAGIAARWLKRRMGIPYIVTEHWGIYNNAVTDNFESRSYFFRQSVKKVIKDAAGFISVSRYLAEGVNRLVTKKEYTVIENTVDTSVFNYLPKSPGRFRFIHVSNMVPLKNTEGILRSFRSFLKQGGIAELVMVGDTDGHVRKLAKELGLTENEVQFKGEVPYPQVAAAMQQADCFILFSNIENSPCVIGEALCCGLPVIASSVGGVPELLSNENSMLVPAGNEGTLTSAMQMMLQHTSSYNRKKIAEDAVGKFSYSVIGKKISDMYKNA